MIALPLHRVKSTESLDDLYKPNHHIFYAFRAHNVKDAIPKWKTLPEGEMVTPQNDDKTGLPGTQHLLL